MSTWLSHGWGKVLTVHERRNVRSSAEINRRLVCIHFSEHFGENIPLRQWDATHDETVHTTEPVAGDTEVLGLSRIFILIREMRG